MLDNWKNMELNNKKIEVAGKYVGSFYINFNQE